MNLGELERVKETLENIMTTLEREVGMINPDDNQLPVDGLRWLVSIQEDSKNLIAHLDDYNSYDLG